MTEPAGTSQPQAARLGGGVVLGDERLVLLAGPCVVESRDLVFEVAESLVALCTRLEVPLVFKASFDKANRTSGSSYRGVGFDEGLSILSEVRSTLGVPVVTDVHDAGQVPEVAAAVDVLQIPAFLCRQTDLLAAAGASGRAVNVKKGQFLAPDDTAYAAEKVRAAGGADVALTERGTTFGHHDLVVDFRGLAVMRRYAPVIFDATHSVQSPGGAGGASGGNRAYVAPLARAAVAFGVDGLFVETHPDPDRAPSDGANMVPLHAMEDLLQQCLAVHRPAAAVG